MKFSRENQGEKIPVTDEELLQVTGGGASEDKKFQCNAFSDKTYCNEAKNSGLGCRWDKSGHKCVPA